MQPSPSPRESIIYAVGSGLLSSLLAGAMGRVYGLPVTIVMVMMVLTALLGGLVGYRSRRRQD